MNGQKNANLASKQPHPTTPLRPFRPTKKNMLNAIEKSFGNITRIAKLFGWGTDRKRVYKYIDKFNLRDEIEAARDVRVDIAEGSLDEMLIAKDKDAVFFVLKTLGRNRGYGENLTPDPHNFAKATAEQIAHELD